MIKIKHKNTNKVFNAIDEHEILYDIAKENIYFAMELNNYLLSNIYEIYCLKTFLRTLGYEILEWEDELKPLEKIYYGSYARYSLIKTTYDYLDVEELEEDLKKRQQLLDSKYLELLKNTKVSNSYKELRELYNELGKEEFVKEILKRALLSRIYLKITENYYKNTFMVNLPNGKSEIFCSFEGITEYDFSFILIFNFLENQEVEKLKIKLGGFSCECCSGAINIDIIDYDTIMLIKKKNFDDINFKIINV